MYVPVSGFQGVPVYIEEFKRSSWSGLFKSTDIEEVLILRGADIEKFHCIKIRNFLAQIVSTSL